MLEQLLIDNVLRKETIIPESNIRELPQPIVPERLTSTTSPINGSIMPPEYNSVTKPAYNF